jgi:hypothetical protein
MSRLTPDTASRDALPCATISALAERRITRRCDRVGENGVDENSWHRTGAGDTDAARLR